jgi:hypothetical protein
MVLQVGGSISFAPETEGRQGKMAVRRHPPHAAELTPVPDQVTVTVNTSQYEHLRADGSA